jgi:hypothetical protein
MTALRTNKTSLDRRSLATQAIQTAAATRAEAGVSQAGPICIYAVCETLGVNVRFNNINMEGMYQRGAQPRIHLSARRPLPRRAFNCAHELGHHKFRHGTSIDELREDAKSNPWEDPKEFLADTFAGFVLRPPTEAALSSNVPIRSADLWSCPNDGLSNAPLRGSIAASTEKRSRSCASHQSASCSENSAIRPEVSGRTLRVTNVNLYCFEGSQNQERE